MSTRASLAVLAVAGLAGATLAVAFVPLLLAWAPAWFIDGFERGRRAWA